MAYVVEKKVSLAFLGEGWTDAALVFSTLSFRETREFANLSLDADKPDADQNVKSFDLVADMLVKKFIRGNAWNGTELVDIKADELLDLPVEIINESIKALAGTVSPN